MEVPGSTFVQLNSAKMDGMLRDFGEYIKNLKRQKEPMGEGMPTATGADQAAGKKTLDITPTGFPIIHDIDFDTLKKEELEDLLRSYLGKHYSESLQPDSYKI